MPRRQELVGHPLGWAIASFTPSSLAWERCAPVAQSLRIVHIDVGSIWSVAALRVVMGHRGVLQVRLGRRSARQLNRRFRLFAQAVRFVHSR